MWAIKNNPRKGIRTAIFGVEIFVLILALSSIVSASSTECYSCADCTSKLNGGYDTVYLNNSIYDVLGKCITFGASNVVFDCQGHSINGNSVIDGDTYAVKEDTDSGIHLNKKSGNTIKNCGVNDFYTGIYLYMSRDNTIINNKINNNSIGIELFSDYNYNSARNNLITNNTMSLNDKGVFLYSASDNIISNNKISSNDVGIYGLIHWSGYSCKNNIIKDNIVISNDNGIELYLCYAEIYNNLFNNTNNFDIFEASNWNITKQRESNIVGGPYLGGNFWANPSGAGFSETCSDANYDGICDESYTLFRDNIDYLPLTYSPAPLVMSVSPQSSDILIIPGQEDRFNVSVDISGAEMKGATFDLLYDNSILVAEAVTQSPFIGSCNPAIIKNNIDNSVGKVEFDFGCMDGTLAGGGSIAVVTFKTINEGTTTLGLSDAELSDIDGQPRVIEIENGTANITYAVSMRIVPQVTETAINDTFNISVDISGALMKGATFDLQFLFDKSIIRAEALTVGSFMESCNPTIIKNNIDNSMGKVEYDFGCMDGALTGEGTIAVITFKALTEGIGDLVLSNAGVSDENGQPRVLIIENGVVYVEVYINLPPTAPVVDVVPGSPTTFDDLSCNIITPSTDAENDIITYTYLWYNDGILQDDLTTETVGSEKTSKGETWTCEVIPSDGTDTGDNGTDSVTIANIPPVADTGSDMWSYTNKALIFDGSNSYDADGVISTYSWDFGDGSSGDGETATHSYTSTGTYTVTLTVTDDDGVSASDTMTVTIHLAGDITHDGCVSFIDLLMYEESHESNPGDIVHNPNADFTDVGESEYDIDFWDFMALLANYDDSC